MKKAENQIAMKRDLGETVFLALIPSYLGGNDMPYSIRMTAYGDRGYGLNINILNNLGGAVIDYELFN